jgi:hypothetical protein
MLEHIEWLVHQNRLLKIAREGGQMKPADLAKFEPQRRYVTLVALAVEGKPAISSTIGRWPRHFAASCSPP